MIERLALALGIAVTFSLVQGCSTAEPIPPGDDPTAGDEDPGTSTAGDEQTSESAAPGEEPAVPTAENPGMTPGAPAEPPPAAKSKMTFFVTSTGNGAQGGNLGGLAGADKKCQDLATAAGGGDHTWRAYLSVQGTAARDRIGAGPWFNQKGKMIAADVAALHTYQFVPSSTEDILDEKGAVVPPNRRMILTGSKQDGTPLNQTCQNWTSANGGQNGRVGDSASDTSVLLGVRWNDAVKSYGCSQQAMNQNKGDGRTYCFAID